jgi:hypothetical protein
VLLCLLGVPSSPTHAQTFAISPAKVHIDGLYPGARASFELTIHNRHDSPRAFSLAARTPWDPREGRSELPNASWVDFAPARVQVPANDSSEVTVTVSVPGDEQWKHGDWETWLGVTPADADFLVVNCYVRLLISTRESPPASVNYPLIIVLALAAAVALSGWRLSTSLKRHKPGK